MHRILAVSAAFILVISSGVVNGVWTARWHTSAALQTAVSRVPDVPLVFGDWQGQPLEVDTQALAKAGAQSYWMRRYHNTRTGAVVSSILMCGRSGPMAVHTPDVCYSGAGYRLESQPQRVTLTVPGLADSAQLWTGRFRKDNIAAEGGLRLWWSWSAAGDWQAPDNPRFTFRGQRPLYKLYVIEEVAEAGLPEQEAGTAFFQDFLPALQKALFLDLGR